MITIWMATYNGEAYVGEQIASIQAQTVTDWQLIVHDDGSSDRTGEIVRAFADKDARIHYSGRDAGNASKAGSTGSDVDSEAKSDAGDAALFFGSTRGAAANFLGMVRQSAAGASAGPDLAEYGAFCDQDDLWHPDKLEKTLAAMQQAEAQCGNDTPILVYTDLAVADQDGKPYAPSLIRYMQLPPKLELPRLLMQNSVTGCTVMVNRALYQLLARVPAGTGDAQVVMHDHFAALAAVTLGKTVFVPEATLDYRQHGKNSVGAADAGSFAYRKQRFLRGGTKFREDMAHAMDQAALLMELYGREIEAASHENAALIRGFADLKDAGKLSRVRFYLKNKVLKYGRIRLVMQLLWG